MQKLKAYALITPAAELPILPEDARKHLLIDGTDSDAQIEAWQHAALEEVLNYTQRRYMQETWELQMSCWDYDCNGYLRLEKGPLVAIASVKYYDTTNTLVTIPTSDYQVVTAKVPGLIRFIGTLPQVYDRPDAIQIRFVAGYGAESANADAQRLAIPFQVKAWVKLRLTSYHENRQNVITGATAQEVPTLGIDSLHPFRLYL